MSVITYQNMYRNISVMHLVHRTFKAMCDFEIECAHSAPRIAKLKPRRG